MTGTRKLPNHTGPQRWLVAIPFAAAIGLVAASCGGSTPHKAAAAAPAATTVPTTPGAPLTTAPATAPVAVPAVLVGQTSLGMILTDAQSRTLYLFEKDTGTTSTCYSACASAWPPVTTTDARPTVAGGANQAMLGTTMRSDGTTQLTYAGHPLYRFAGDRKPGDTTGQGLQAFGGGWDVLTPAGQKVDNGG